jgi:predicted DNA-binding protein (UPF0251 family)
MNKLMVVKRENVAGLILLRKPVRKAEPMAGRREATTGRVVVDAGQPMPAVMPRGGFMPRVIAMPTPIRLERVQAMAEEFGSATDTAVDAGEARAPQVELAFYRKYTEGMLRRYVTMSTQTGRVPSLLGRELFQGNVSSYKVRSFEDAVIFCFDVEKVLARLSVVDKELIRRVAMQQYTQGEAASMLGMSLANLKRLYGAALDRLTGMLIEARLMDPLKSCQ